MIVALGCGVRSFVLAFFKENVDWALEDPKGKSLDKLREIRDEIERRVQRLISG